MKKIKQILSTLLACCLLAVCLPLSAGAAEAATSSQTFAPTEAEVYQAMIALKDTYPEGMSWTNDNFYAWHGGGGWSGGYGCAGFAFLLSDAAFGTLPARTQSPVSFDQVRVGDILRINGNTHSVIVLEVHENHVVIAEGNYNFSIHWGRTLTKAQVLQADYMMTRYPAEPAEPDESTEPVEPDEPAEAELRFTDVKESDYFFKAVSWAAENGITNGITETTFVPYGTCTRAQVVTFLWRAAGEPEPSGNGAGFADVANGQYYTQAVAWAVEQGIVTGMAETTFAPGGGCTRAQLVTMLHRAAGAPGTSESSAFNDVSSEAYYSEAVQWAVERGLTTGTTDTTFSPDANCVRGQLVTFLYRNSLL